MEPFYKSSFLLRFFIAIIISGDMSAFIELRGAEPVCIKHNVLIKVWRDLEMMPRIISDPGWLFHFVKAFESQTEYKSFQHLGGTK